MVINARTVGGELRCSVRAVRIRRKARCACHRRDGAAEVAVAASFAGQSASSTRSLWRTLSPCAWCVCASAGCRSCCRWPGNRGTGTFGRCVCGSGANDWSPVCRRPGISTAPASQATRRTSRDKTDRPARWASYLQTQHAFMRISSVSPLTSHALSIIYSPLSPLFEFFLFFFYLGCV